MVLAVLEALVEQVLNHQDPIGDEAARLQHKRRRLPCKRKFDDDSAPVSAQEVIEEVAELPDPGQHSVYRNPVFKAKEDIRCSVAPVKRTRISSKGLMPHS